jgi:two-component system cell cycle sensor histidine kinase/response regulator CckA
MPGQKSKSIRKSPMTPSQTNKPIKPFRRKSLATQLTWVSILLVTLALATVGTGLILIAQRTQRESAFRLQEKTAEQFSQSISGYISRAVDRLTFFLDTTPLWRQSVEQQKASIEHLLAGSLPLYCQITLLDREGHESSKASLFHTFLPKELRDLPQDPAFRAGLKGERYMGPVSFLDNTGFLTVPIGVPVRRPTGEITGVIVAEINVSHLWQDVARIKVGRSGYAYLVDRKGRFVAYQMPAEVLQRYGEDVSGFPPVSEFIAGDEEGAGHVREYEGLFGEEVIGVNAPIPGTHWAVVVEQPGREAYASITQMLTYLMYLMLISIPLAGGVGFYISRRLIKPIGELTEAARRLEAGDLKTEFSLVQRQDEVGVLALAFKRMQKELLNLYGGLQSKIDELEITQRALRKSEENYRTVLDSSPDPVIVYDLEGKVLYLNLAFTKVFGWTLDEQVGKPLENFVPKERWPEIRALIQKVTVRGESFSGVETRLYNKKGGVLDISMSGSAYRESEGKINAIVFNLRDITERKDLQRKLHRAQKMESMGVMAGGVAHDLNNILSGIVSYPELLLMDLPEDSRLRKPIMIIQRSGMQAAEVVADLLTIARGIATGKVVLNINAIITEYLGSAEHQELKGRFSQVDYRVDLDSELLNMRGSPTHIKKTLMNLVINASEAVEKIGNVTISTFNRYLDEPLKGYENVQTGEYAVLRVSDDGPGISPEDMERIFEPFYTKKIMGRSGTGLGLAVVWNAVQAHNGYINVDAKEGETVFDIYFPVTREEISDEAQKIHPAEYCGRGEMILVVDDEKGQREIACGMLSKLGYKVETVPGGKEAVDYIRSQPVDLIVLDMVMPKGITGRETYEAILRICPGQKAVIASGYAKTEEVEHTQALGAGEFIRKPYSLEKIGLAVRRELDRQ